MPNTGKARVFMSGSAQFVTIPAEFHFRSSEVQIRRDPNGNIVLSEVPSVAEVFAALDGAKLPDDFMSAADRERRPAQDHPGLDKLFDEDVPESKE